MHITDYIPLTTLDYSVRTVNYGRVFFSSIYGPSEKGIERKKQGSVINSADRENEGTKILIISLYLGIECAGREAVSV